ncbi:MAG: DUF4249 domain-containing protein [Bacteroidetes bacterium]|nr:DUF4249 domain-containing protein [Bacteroidota bacterium]MBU1485639.1 DUF4249 domain-containing protein [Bacteroidota bacterium]MBU2046472.1 DUF4249 domain-containing protein [Bacteroidota bacterium]MBU2268306.1 DUF4249 domain-containing protein [Bacteroidota bacterium]MBU2376954.1 DUF4249 domain-containing protein [Bacteroidota bacterium]
MKKAFIYLTIISLGFILACEKNITVKPPVYKNKVSIQGFIEPDSIPIIYFNHTVPYFDKAVKKNQLIVRNAQIAISSSNSTDFLKLDSIFDKIDCQYNFFYRGHNKIQRNTKYNLSILADGKTYTASATTDLGAPVIDSTSYVTNYNDLYGEHEGVIIYFKDVSNQTNFYRYEMKRSADTSTKKAEAPIVSTCLGNGTIQVNEIGRAVFNDVGNEGKQLKIVIEPAYSHKKGTKGDIYIQSFDKNAYDFFAQLDRQKLAQYNPFIEPVFLQEGQFGNAAIGFFAAKQNSSFVTFIYPE